jgi:hypothetical protein
MLFRRASALKGQSLVHVASICPCKYFYVFLLRSARNKHMTEKVVVSFDLYPMP